MNKLRILFSKGTLLNRLLRKYAVTMIDVTIAATVIFSIHTWEQNQRQVENMTSDAVQDTNRMLNDKTALSRIIKNQFVGNSEEVENVTTYLTKPIDRYLMYVCEQQNSTDELVSFPNQIKDLYANYEELDAIYIALNQLPEYYESSREGKGGGIERGTPKLLDAFYIKLPITQGGAESGGIFIGF